MDLNITQTSPRRHQAPSLLFIIPLVYTLFTVPGTCSPGQEEPGTPVCGYGQMLPGTKYCPTLPAPHQIYHKLRFLRDRGQNGDRKSIRATEQYVVSKDITMATGGVWLMVQGSKRKHEEDLDGSLDNGGSEEREGPCHIGAWTFKMSKSVGHTLRYGVRLEIPTSSLSLAYCCIMYNILARSVDSVWNALVMAGESRLYYAWMTSSSALG
jgi:hypothetical protein